MLRLASFQIDRAAYDDGVFIVFLVTADDSLCGSKDPPKPNRKGSFEETEPLTSCFFGIKIDGSIKMSQILIFLLLSCNVKVVVYRKKTFMFSVTEAISKNILGWYYLLRIALTIVVALCVLAFHISCNAFNDKRLDKMIEEEVKEIKMKEEIRANIENVAVAIMKSGAETQVKIKEFILRSLYRVTKVLGGTHIMLTSK